MMYKRIFPVLLVWLVVVSCRDKTTHPSTQHIVSVTEVDSFTQAEFRELLSAALGPTGSQVAPFVQSGITRYRVVYKTTDIDGSPITASGAVVVPQNISGPVALASLQHGTLFNEADAPSYLKSGSEATIGSFFGTLGIVIAMPDYIGYGESKDRPHPYEHKNGLAIPTVDFLKAVKEFMSNENISWNKKVLLAGYSEGGYATMAAYQYLEQNLKSELPVTVCVPGAGAYNKTASFDLLINSQSSGDINHNRSYIWVLLTYLRDKKIDRPLSYFFKEPYASEIASKGHLAVINVSLNKTLQPGFIEDFNTGKIPEIHSAISENDVFDWKPGTELRMYHGNADEYVPYLNSSTALEAMRARGAEKVNLITIQNGTHSSSLTSYIMGVLELFLSNK